MDTEHLAERYATDSIRKYLDNKKEPKTQHVMLDRVFPVERRIRSIMGGLETSLGTTFWETLAKKIAKQNGFSLKNPKDFQKPSLLPLKVSNFLTEIKQKREDPNKTTNYEEILEKLQSICFAESKGELDWVEASSGDGVDLWFTKEGNHYIFDTKTVNINAASANNFANKVLHWYAYFWLKYPDKKLIASIAFPYSPYSPTFDANSWWKQNGGRAKPLERNKDALVQNEFWDLLGGENTWESILSGFDNVDSEKLREDYSRLFYGK